MGRAPSIDAVPSMNSRRSSMSRAHSLHSTASGPHHAPALPQQPEEDLVLPFPMLGTAINCFCTFPLHVFCMPQHHCASALPHQLSVQHDTALLQAGSSLHGGGSGGGGQQGEAQLPASPVYKDSCEHFSWPLLEPQVKKVLDVRTFGTKAFCL